MHLPEGLLRNFQLSNDERETILDDLLKINQFRLLVIACSAGPLSIIHICILVFSMHTTDPASQTWKSFLIYAHSSIIIFFSATAAILYFGKKSALLQDIRDYLMLFSTVFITTMSAIIAGVDQIVSLSVGAYLAGCLIVAVVFILSPLRAFAVYISSYVVFAGLQYIIIPTETMFISNIVQGLTSVVFGMGFSLIMWRSNIITIRQSKKIIEQQEKLENTNKQLLVTTDLLQEANKTKEKFIAIIGHDLRGPLSTLSSAFSLLIEDNEIDEADKNRLLQSLYSSTNNTLRLLENLLLWAKNQSEQISLNAEKVSLFELVEDSLSYFALSISEKNITITFDALAEKHAFADREMAMTVFRNLISNAIKYTPNGGLITISVAPLPLTAGTPLWNISVTDNGIGMADEVKNTLFKVDQLASQPGTSKERGTGLGLLLCKEFIEKHNCSLTVESVPGKGTIIHFTLPQG